MSTLLEHGMGLPLASLIMCQYSTGSTTDTDTATDLPVLGEVAEEAAVVPVEQAEGLG